VEVRSGHTRARKINSIIIRITFRPIFAVEPTESAESRVLVVQAETTKATSGAEIWHEF
jgi:hypothetical protein